MVARDRLGRTPAVAPGGRVYVGLTESPAPRVGYSRFVALRPDGTTLWRRAMGKNNFPSSPAIANNGMVFVTQKWGLLAVSASGEVLWRRHGLRGSVTLGHDGTVYVFRRFGEYDYRLVAVASGGDVKWTSAVRFGGLGPPVVVGEDGTIYANTAPGLVALSSQGAVKWAIRARVGMPALGPDGTVYVVTSAGALRAFTPDGQEKWRRRVGKGLDQPVSVDAAGTVYVPAVENGAVMALRPDGSVKWRFHLPAQHSATSAIAIADGRLYFYSTRGTDLWR